MSELEIPERAYIEGYLGSDERDVIRRAAPIIVAAELRRLAEEVEHSDSANYYVLKEAAEMMRDRADELDPEGNTRDETGQG